MATLSASSISKSRATGLAVTGIKFRLLASFALIVALAPSGGGNGWRAFETPGSTISTIIGRDVPRLTTALGLAADGARDDATLAAAYETRSAAGVLADVARQLAEAATTDEVGRAHSVFTANVIPLNRAGTVLSRDEGAGDIAGPMKTPLDMGREPNDVFSMKRAALSPSSEIRDRVDNDARPDTLC